MQITVFGASGKVGRLVVQEALNQGNRVVAFIHRQNLLPEKPGLVFFQGDVLNANDVIGALLGSRAVISVLSSWHAPHRNTLSEGMRLIIPAMEEAGITRLISLTGGDARDVQDRPGQTNLISRTALLIIGRKVVEDADEHIRLLRNSDLEWTVVRSPLMTNGKSDRYSLQTTLIKPWQTVSRKAVAECLVDQVKQGALRQVLNLRAGRE